MNFDYLCTTIVGNNLEVDDIGNCAIRAYTDYADEYYLVIKTSLGWTEIVEYGPIVQDLDTLSEKMMYTYDRFEYSEYKIEKRIDKFLNRRDKIITQAFVTDIEEIKPLIKDFLSEL